MSTRSRPATTGYPDTMSTTAEPAKQPDPFRQWLVSAANITAGAATGFVLLFFGAPLWLLSVLAACYLGMSFRRFTTRQRRHEADAAAG